MHRDKTSLISGAFVSLSLSTLSFELKIPQVHDTDPNARLHVISVIRSPCSSQLIGVVTVEVAFDLPFTGNITLRNDILVKTHSSHLKHMTIIQSQGSGKSRLMHEVSKMIFTLPLNVRNQAHDHCMSPVSRLDYAADLYYPSKVMYTHLLTRWSTSSSSDMGMISLMVIFSSLPCSRLHCGSSRCCLCPKRCTP